MPILSRRAAALALACVLVGGPAGAQTAAPAAKADAAAETKAAPSQPTEKRLTRQRAPGSAECSKEADARGLKGRERRKFRKECKKAAAEKAAAGEKDKP